jgi:WD40 repeat protein
MKWVKKSELIGHASSIYAICNNQQKIYTASGDTFVARWDLNTLSQDGFAIKSEASVYAIQLIRDSSLLVIGTSSGSLHVIDLQQKKEIHHILQHKEAIFCIVENKLKNQLYVSDAVGNISVWDSNSFELLLNLPLEVGKIRAILVDEVGANMYIGGQDGKIRVFETVYFNEVHCFRAHQDGVNCLSFHPDKPKVLLSGGKDGFLRVWDRSKFSKIIEIPAHNFGIYALQFVNNNKQFISISRDKSIKVWNANTLEVVQKIERKQGGHSHAVNSICKIDELSFVTVGDDKRIIWWEFII